MLKRILFTTAFLAMFSPTGSWAFLPFACPPVPVCPMPDIPDELASLMEGIADLGRQVQSLKNQVTNDANNIFSALKSVYEGNLSTAIDVSKDNAGQRALENCIYKGKEYNEI